MSEDVHSIQVLIAALNEEEGVGLTIAELTDYLDTPRILVIDGKSTDKTVEIARITVQKYVIRMTLAKAMR